MSPSPPLQSPAPTRAREGRAIARNALSSYGVRLLAGLQALLLTPYLFRHLGPASFGTWSVMFTVATVFALLEAGFAAGITKLVAEMHGRGEREEADRVIGAAVVLYALLGVLAAAVAIGTGLFASGLAASGDEHAFRVGMLVLGGVMLVRFPLVAFGAALSGYQRFDLFYASEAIVVGGFPVGAVIAVQAGAGVLGVAVAFAAALLAGAAAYLIALWRLDGRSPLRTGRDGLHARGARRRIAAFSSLTLLADSMIFLGQRMDTVVIAAIRGALSAGPYAAALKLQTAIQSLTLPFVTLVMPMMSELWGREDRDEVRRRFALATRIALQLTLPFALGFALFSDDIVGVWLGSRGTGSTASIVVVLMAAQVIGMTAAPAAKTLIGIGRVRTVAMLQTAEGIGNLAVSVVLVTAYGAIGAAIGTLIATGVVGPLLIPLTCREIGMRARTVLARSVVAPVLASLPAAAVMVAVRLLMDEGAARLAVGLTLGLVTAALAAAAHPAVRRAVRALPASLRARDRVPAGRSGPAAGSI